MDIKNINQFQLATHKEVMEELLTSTDSVDALNRALITQYDQRHNPLVIDYLAHPKFAKSLKKFYIGQNLLTLALQKDDIPFIKKLIAQPAYQNNKGPTPGLTYLSTCSDEAFLLLYNANLYEPSDLQKVVYKSPQNYSTNSLVFLFERGYQLSLFRLLNASEELLGKSSQATQDYVNLYQKVAVANIDTIDETLLALTINKLEIMAQAEQALFSNEFIGCAMVLASVLSAQPEPYYVEVGEAIAHKIIYAIELSQECVLTEYSLGNETETELSKLQHYYLTIPPLKPNPLSHEELKDLIKDFEVKVERNKLQSSLTDYTKTQPVDNSTKPTSTFKL